ncbi:hypothetical protein AB0L53_27215 [Nonomuraea sp. NPDC052129]|uniref:hypothetical protein n=1 Tax=Nonomuraea sp. NPDC052129 TaxID=3154651 RepID=UPI003448BC05
MNAYEQHLEEAPEAAAKIAELEDVLSRLGYARRDETWQLRPAVVVVAKKAE